MSLLSKIYSSNITAAAYARIHNPYMHQFSCLATEQENKSLVESYSLEDNKSTFKSNSLRHIQSGKR